MIERIKKRYTGTEWIKEQSKERKKLASCMCLSSFRYKDLPSHTTYLFSASTAGRIHKEESTPPCSIHREKCSIWKLIDSFQYSVYVKHPIQDNYKASGQAKNCPHTKIYWTTANDNKELNNSKIEADGYNMQIKQNSCDRATARTLKIL